MPRFVSYDGTELAYRTLGDGPPLVCLPGGPGRAPDYLGDLGGLSESRRLVLLDPRGVGLSAAPADPATFRVDRLVDDVEALRGHLGLDQMDLLAHSAGSVLGTLYAAAHPERLSALILITPGLAAIGVEGSEQQFGAVVARLATEPWYPAAMAAMEKIMAGRWSMEAFRDSRALFYGRWDEVAQEHATAGVAVRHQAAREGYFGEVAFDVSAIRSALKQLAAPVLLYAGELDPLVTPAMVREAASLFGGAAVVVQPGAGHFPWIDDPAAFAAAIGSFLG
ncbi:MAG TPA: alpha/beta hydrolase [Streptosporangiaceae bacterium]|nr:alpha/beta hydrolase [Streptosporangiaceae bacterium]